MNPAVHLHDCEHNTRTDVRALAGQSFSRAAGKLCAVAARVEQNHYLCEGSHDRPLKVTADAFNDRQSELC
jgi:hypothetical protein